MHDIDGNVVGFGGDSTGGGAGDFCLDLTIGDTYIFYGMDSYGDGWNGATATITDADGNILWDGWMVEVGSSANITFTLESSGGGIPGCTDSNAISCNDEIDVLYFPECSTCPELEPCNNYYNEIATVDNGLCMYNDTPNNDEFISVGLYNIISTNLSI